MLTTDIILFGILFVNTLIFLVLTIPQISNGHNSKTKVSYASMQPSLQEPPQIKQKTNRFSLRKKEPDDFYEKLMAEGNEVKS
jgi:hypothetical protein